MQKPRSDKRQIVWNTLTGWGYKVLKIGIALVTNPLLIAGLGREGYALITLLATLVSFSELTDLGLRPALGRELAEARSRQDAATYNRLVSSAMLAYGVLFLLLAAALWVATPALAGLMAGKKAALTHEAIWLIRTYGVFALAIAFARPGYSAVLASANRFDFRNQAETVFTVLNGAGLIAVLTFTNWGLGGWVAVAVATQAFNLVQIILYAHRAQPSLRVHFSLARFAELKRLYAFGSLLFVSQWAKKIKFDADPLLIAKYLSPAAVALYKPASSLMANVRPLLITFAGQLYPVTTKLFIDKNIPGIRALFLHASRYTLLMAVPVAVFFGCYSREVMDLWLGAVLAPAEITIAGNVLAGWALIELAVALEGSAWAVLFGMRKVQFIIWIEVVAALLNLAASWYLLAYSNLGVMAVVVPSVLIEGLIRPAYAWYAGHCTQLSGWQTISGVYTRPVVVGIGLLGTAYLFKQISLAYGWLPLGLHGAGIGLTYMVLVVTAGLTAHERSQIQAQIVRRLQRGKAK